MGKKEFVLIELVQAAQCIMEIITRNVYFGTLV